jgi:hypothetical protein
MPAASANVELTIRPMASGDTVAVAEMARELAAVLDDPEPALDPNDLARDGTGPERWFDCLGGRGRRQIDRLRDGLQGL